MNIATVNFVGGLAMMAMVYWLCLLCALQSATLRGGLARAYEHLSGPRRRPYLALALGAATGIALRAFDAASRGPLQHMTLPFNSTTVYLVCICGGIALTGSAPLLGSRRSLAAFTFAYLAACYVGFDRNGFLAALVTTPGWLLLSLVTSILITKKRT